MSKLDDEVIDRLRTAEKPVFVDPELFAALTETKSRRERRRRLGVLASVIAVITVGAGAFALANQNGLTAPVATGASPSGFVSPGTAGASLPGVPFPACHVSSITYVAPDVGAVYLFAAGSENSCPDVAGGNAFVAVYEPGLITPRSKPQLVGPIDCATGCRIFGTPDIDLDGHPELAIVVVDGTGADSIELYRLRPDGHPPIVQIEAPSPNGPTPLSFDWGGVGVYRAGASCSRTEPNVLDVWTAEERGGDWHVVQRFLRLHGSRVAGSSTSRYTTGLPGSLPAGGGNDFCGASVTP
jgi:hypothetical protein